MGSNACRAIDTLRILLILGVMIGGCQIRPEQDTAAEDVRAGREPRLDPDYAGVTIPPNIAPLNFTLGEPGSEYQVEIYATGGDTLRITSTSPGVVIPLNPWRNLLQANRGEELCIAVRSRGADGKWVRFNPVRNTIATEGIDPYIVYRLLKPLYNKYVNIGIYQRNLENYDESTILHNRSAEGACLNCHTFLQQRPDPMILHTRGRYGLTMLLAHDGEVTRIGTRTEFNASPAAYASWHPSGRLLAFSVNKFSLFFHTEPERETRDVFDADSDLVLYRISDNLLTTAPQISSPERAETWPEWAPDGRHLYFASAPVLPIERFKEVRYDLMRIGYDPDQGTWGTLDTVLSAATTGLSITQPKISPDGRFLVFCMAEYGNFPVFLPSSDLYVMELATGQYRRLEINSDRTDSWHSWSSNSRWLVFSSKRRDGLFSRPYFSYVDEAGRFHKPMLLPQEDPVFYDSFVKNYNLPVFVTGPVQVSAAQLGRAVFAPEDSLQAQLDPQVQVHKSPGAGLPAEPYSSGAPR
ncbi:MAG: PD40 domain-containing protein [Candidatus Latescibacteria bacterium]|nr:PD40 domain-containing protein [Candidatus Latescibacterota bacterium]